MHPRVVIAECALPRRADALRRRSSSVTPNCFCVASSPVRYSRPGSAQTLSGILPDPPVVRGGRSRQMTTPSSDDVPGSADRISPRYVLEMRIGLGREGDG